MAEIATDVTITFASGFFAEALNVNLSGWERESIDVTHQGTTVAREFLPSKLYDPGEMEVEMQFVPGTAPPISSAPETITLTFTDTPATTYQMEGFMSAFTVTSELENKYTANSTIKFSGAITVA